MKKLYIDKNDSTPAIIEKILGVEEDQVILYVPRFTKFGASPNNFRLLKREIDSSEKTIEIESVDDDVLETAKSVGIKATNPFFRKNKRAVSDIISPGDRASRRDEVDASDSQRSIVDGIEIEEEEHAEAMTDSDESVDYHRKAKISFHVRAKRHITGKNPLKTGAILLLAASIVAGAVFFLPSAKVLIKQEKFAKDFSVSVVSSTVVKEPYFSNGQVRISGAVLEKIKNATSSHPATGSEEVERKASGTITVFNAYSSDPQPLVKDTRFSSPDGKVFRIAKGVVIPGAKIVNNKVVPSSIDLIVYADKAGEAFNIGPASFRVPGFQGSPKYEGFYGESKEAMAGGFIGTLKVPTASDITKAKEASRKSLEKGALAEILLTVPTDVKILDNASKFIIAKEDVDKNVDSSGNFSVTTSGTARVFGFKEADIVNTLRVRLAEELKLQSSPGETPPPAAEDLVLKEGSLQYGEPRIDFDKKEMAVALKFKSIWTRSLDLDKFKNLVLSKGSEEVDAVAKQFAGIESINLSLWPFWVWSVPGNPSKVSIDVE